MGFQIEIIEGHDPSSYFWFRPVILKETGLILWKDVTELEEEFSIEDGVVECFLSYFLCKYFDQELTYNNRRYEPGEGHIVGFEWNLIHNFYNYEALRKMAKEIEDVANLLEVDYDNPQLDGIKNKFSIFYICDEDDLDYANRDNTAIQKHVSVAIDFYRRFTKRIIKMMNNNKNATAISVMGP